jgi:peptidyl-prolyl cis-trans isomerase B (cyclophilin B)
MSKTVEITTSAGAFRIELDDAKAPVSTQNFLEYVRAGHYDGTVFHRVIKGFMVQGGGFEPGMKQRAARAPITNEANNGLKNDKYTLAMARTSAPHSASAQFFINTVDNGFLNFKSSPLRAGVTRCSARWCPAPTWSTRSKAWPRDARACTTTSRSTT